MIVAEFCIGILLFNLVVETRMNNKIPIQNSVIMIPFLTQNFLTENKVLSLVRKELLSFGLPRIEYNQDDNINQPRGPT